MQNTQAHYLKELEALKTRQDDLWSQQNHFYHTMRTQQEEMAKEIQEAKKYQVNQTLMQFRRDLLEKIEERIHKQENEIIEMHSQIKEWTKNASSREAYCCWAHQQANPNLVLILIHDIPKFVHSNAAKGKHIFQGALKTHQQGKPSQPSHTPMAEPEKN
ncbi:hypothetical protein PIB30_084910 [Stylosanthes scabra]|uniref:Uncharacterized protein n=1 Tax=Stylosanthes scabra TaxID=79078 RepID=A0ABU6UWE4_9FABA|nr:hypothetical protein [Stylosanthes scabra]